MYEPETSDLTPAHINYAWCDYGNLLAHATLIHVLDHLESLFAE